MTKFLAYYNLLQIHDTKEFLGVSPDSDSGNIIATMGRNIAVVIKISTQKQIKSWSVLEKFTSKVVYDHKSQQYVAIIANRFVRLWDENVSDINKCKKLKFHKNIAELIYTPQEAVVLYADGTCESLSSAIHTRKEHTADNLQMEALSNVSFIDAKIIQFNDGRKMLTYFQKIESKPIELVTMHVNGYKFQQISRIKKTILQRPGQDIQLSGYAIIETELSPALFTIWSDGRVFLGNLITTAWRSNSPGTFVSMFNDLKVDTPLTILGVSKNCVAIYGANVTQEGGSLLLYNTQFKVVKAKQFFKIYFNFSRLWLSKSSILLAMGQNLAVVSYQTSKETLSELVGSQISNDFSQTVAAEFVNEEEELEEHLCLAEVQKPFFNYHRIQKSNKIHEPKDKEADGKTIPLFPNYHRSSKSIWLLDPKDKDKEILWADAKKIPFQDDEKFKKQLNKLINQDVHVELVQTDSGCEEIEINTMANYVDSGFVSEEVHIIAKQLEQCGASEHEITEKLLSVLIKADLVEDIGVCLRRYTNISERILVQTLKYVLQDFKITTNQLDKNPEKALTNGNHMEVDIPALDDNEFPNVDLLEKHPEPKNVKHRQDLLNIILSCSFDVETIRPHIARVINYDETIKMLEYLYILIKSDTPCLEERPDFPDNIDEDLQILRWFKIFLDTHFQEMTISKGQQLYNLMIKWNDVFLKYKEQIIDLEIVSARLCNILKKKKFSKEKNYSKWYSIEEVRLF